MDANAMVMEVIEAGDKYLRKTDVIMDVETALDEGMLDAYTSAKARAWLHRVAEAKHAGGKRSSGGQGKGKGKRGWIKQGGTWVATR